jgi:hypothetical protein
MEKHRGKCYEYVRGKFIVMKNIEPHVIRSHFVFALNEVFFLRFQANNDTLYSVLQYIGPAENAAKFKYKVKFVNWDDTESLTIKHLTRSFDENLDDLFKSGNCGKLHYDVVSRLETKGIGIYIKIEIFRVGN